MEYVNAKKILKSRIPLEPIGGIEVVYFLIDFDEIVYVGQTIDLPTRIKIHKSSGKKFDSYFYVECNKGEEMDLVESFYIHTLNPSLNKDVHHGSNKVSPVAIGRLLALILKGVKG